MNRPLRFITPLDGDMLSNAAGWSDGHALFIDVQVDAPPNRRLVLNGAPMRAQDGIYTAAARLDGYRNTLEVADTDSGETVAAGVYWLRHADKKYRVSVDDNIWFLQDIAKNAGVYRSIFDNPYLRVYKDIHDQYGTKVHLNLYYECPEFGGFKLTQMPDTFRDEWRANAHWLRLSFHAWADQPDAPYVHTSYDKVREDYEPIVREIRRFAGDAVLGPALTVHWGSANRQGVRALRAQGIRALMAYLDFDGAGKPIVSYYLTPEQVRQANVYGFYKDHAEDMIFGKVDVVLNSHTPEEITAILDRNHAAYPKKGFFELLIHEQYFYPHYSRYLPDYKERILAGVRWCVEHGCEPAFAGDVVLEEPV